MLNEHQAFLDEIFYSSIKSETKSYQIQAVNLFMEEFTYRYNYSLEDAVTNNYLFWEEVIDEIENFTKTEIDQLGTALNKYFSYLHKEGIISKETLKTGKSHVKKFRQEARDLVPDYHMNMYDALDKILGKLDDPSLGLPTDLNDLLGGMIEHIAPEAMNVLNNLIKEAIDEKIWTKVPADVFIALETPAETYYAYVMGHHENYRGVMFYEGTIGLQHALMLNLDMLNIPENFRYMRTGYSVCLDGDVDDIVTFSPPFMYPFPIVPVQAVEVNFLLEQLLTLIKENDLHQLVLKESEFIIAKIDGDSITPEISDFSTALGCVEHYSTIDELTMRRFKQMKPTKQMWEIGLKYDTFEKENDEIVDVAIAVIVDTKAKKILDHTIIETDMLTEGIDDMMKNLIIRQGKPKSINFEMSPAMQSLVVLCHESKIKMKNSRLHLTTDILLSMSSDMH